LGEWDVERGRAGKKNKKKREPDTDSHAEAWVGVMAAGWHALIVFIIKGFFLVQFLVYL
jgi:hypothetical protein